MTAVSKPGRPAGLDAPACLGCGAPLALTLVDLGLQPLANSYIWPDREAGMEPVYPLHARICDLCLLVQVEKVTPPEHIFDDYAYFSSYSESWLRHCEALASTMVARFGLGPGSRVIEIGSNDGALLQRFGARGIEILGIEPAANVAAAAETKGIPTQIAFFGSATAARLASAGRGADLLVGTNVMAHVPDPDDFVAGIAILLEPRGVFAVEFPHLLSLIRETQFDTIYHEHFTYLSLLAVKPIFERHGLAVFDVEKLPTHGGSLRLFAGRRDAGHPLSGAVERVLAEERAARLDRPEGYAGFAGRVEAVCAGLRAFLAEARRDGHTVAAYGAAAKGNTLLNACGVTVEDIPFVVDRNPTKQGRLLPGSHIPVLHPDALLAARPDFVLILPWNLRDEIVATNAAVKGWGGRFVTAIPDIRID
jgi:predicted TPR repeat methyltransferase